MQELYPPPGQGLVRVEGAEGSEVRDLCLGVRGMLQLGLRWDRSDLHQSVLASPW